MLWAKSIRLMRAQKHLVTSWNPCSQKIELPGMKACKGALSNGGLRSDEQAVAQFRSDRAAKGIQPRRAQGHIPIKILRPKKAAIGAVAYGNRNADSSVSIGHRRVDLK